MQTYLNIYHEYQFSHTRYPNKLCGINLEIRFARAIVKNYSHHYPYKTKSSIIFKFFEKELPNTQ